MRNPEDTSTLVCPHCKSAKSQVKAGMNHGNQRYKCAVCSHRYTPEHKARGYAGELRQTALELHAQGLKPSQIGLQLEVSPRTIINWIRRSAEDLPIVALENIGEAPVVTPEPAAGKRRPNIRDVAEKAGVSASTVSNYLNDKGRMSEETRARITSAMEALHFTPSALVRAIRQRRTRIIGVVIFGLSSLDEGVGLSVTPPILRGINDGADWAEHDLLLYTGWPHRAERHTGLNFLDGHVDGLLWVAPAMHEPAMERAAAAGLPVVALLSRHVPDAVGSVNADNLGAMRALALHLVEQGHERIAYVGRAHSSNYLDRRNGFREAIAAANLQRDTALEVNLKDSEWDSEPYERAIAQLLALSDPPTAIVAPDDGCAAWIIAAARKLGLRVPEDLAVTGFNDVPDAERIGVGLTTIRQPFRRIGQVAAERLIAMIEGASVNDCRITLPTELIVRASTATFRNTPHG